MKSETFKTKNYRRPSATAARRHIKLFYEMTGISIWVSILGFNEPLIPIMILGPPSRGHPPPAVTTKFKGDYRYMVMGKIYGYGCRFLVILAAEFDNVIRF